jgi:hypothetical protein
MFTYALFLCSLTSLPLCFFRLSSISAASVRTEVSCLLAVEFLLGIFGTGLNFLKRLEAVITSGDVSENMILFRLLLEGLGGVDKTV